MDRGLISKRQVRRSPPLTPCAYTHKPHPVLIPVSRGYPRLWGKLPTCYSPVCHWNNFRFNRSIIRNISVRLACLKRAASVRSEPGSNSPSYYFQHPKVSNSFWLQVSFRSIFPKDSRPSVNTPVNSQLTSSFPLQSVVSLPFSLFQRPLIVPRNLLSNHEVPCISYQPAPQLFPQGVPTLYQNLATIVNTIKAFFCGLLFVR